MPAFRVFCRLQASTTNVGNATQSRPSILAVCQANSGKDDAAFVKGWQSARADALAKAGMDVPFKTWE